MMRRRLGDHRVRFRVRHREMRRRLGDHSVRDEWALRGTKARTRLRCRTAILVTCLAVVLAGAPVANAVDDPQPVEWPKAEISSTDARSDPTPVEWPKPQQF